MSSNLKQAFADAYCLAALIHISVLQHTLTESSSSWMTALVPLVAFAVAALSSIFMGAIILAPRLSADTVTRRAIAEMAAIQLVPYSTSLAVIFLTEPHCNAYDLGHRFLALTVLWLLTLTPIIIACARDALTASRRTLG